MVKNNFFQLLVYFFLFSEYDIPLSLDSLRLKFGILQDVGEDVDGSWDVGVEGFGIVDSVFSLDYSSVRRYHSKR